VATQKSSAERRADKGKSRYAPGRRHSPSVSEDGRATSRNEEQRTGPASSTRSGNTLNVPGAVAIPRPASTGVLFTSSSAFSGFPTSSQPTTNSLTGGGGLFGQPSATATTFGVAISSKTASPFAGSFTPNPVPHLLPRR
jgi:hypothetical protein